MEHLFDLPVGHCAYPRFAHLSDSRGVFKRSRTAVACKFSPVFKPCKILGEYDHVQRNCLADTLYRGDQVEGAFELTGSVDNDLYW